MAGYHLDKGWQWNFDHLYEENQNRQQENYQEQANRMMGDTENREAVEQGITDAYLEQVSAQQTITELTLQLIALEARVKALEEK